jgi:hypothetical protein
MLCAPLNFHSSFHQLSLRFKLTQLAYTDRGNVLCNIHGFHVKTFCAMHQHNHISYHIISYHILSLSETLASLRHIYLGSFFLDPEDIRKLSIGAIWNFVEETGLL